MKKISVFLAAGLALLAGCVKDDLSWKALINDTKLRQEELDEKLEGLKKSTTPFMLVMVDAPIDTTVKGLDFTSRFRVNPSGVALTKDMIALDCVSSKRFYSTPPRTKASYVRASESFSLKDLVVDKNAAGEPTEGQYVATLTSASGETVWDESRMAFVGAYLDQEGKTQLVSSDIFQTVMMPLPHEGLDAWMYPHATLYIKKDQKDTLGCVYMPLDGKAFTSTQESESRFYSAQNLIGASFAPDEGCTAPIILKFNEKDHYLQFIPDTTGNETWRALQDTTVLKRQDVTGTLILKDRWNGESHLPLKMSWYNKRQVTLDFEVSAEDIVEGLKVDLTDALKPYGMVQEDVIDLPRFIPAMGGEGGEDDGNLTFVIEQSEGRLLLDQTTIQLVDTPIPGRTYVTSGGIVYGVILTTLQHDSDMVPCTSINLELRVTIKKEPVENLPEKLVGTWREREIDRKSVPADTRKNITVVSATKAYSDTPLDPQKYDPEKKWNGEKTELDITVEGDIATFKEHDSDYSIRMKVVAIDNIQLLFYPLEAGETTPSPAAGISYWERITTQKDYSQKILKLWECKNESTVVDGKYKYANTRIAVKSDGTFDLYKLDENGLWKMAEDRTANQYLLDNDNLGTRWQETGGSMTYEWWTIVRVDPNKMTWAAPRKKADGSVGLQTATWEEVVFPTQAEIEKNLLGKWFVDRINMKSILTDETTVLTFESLSKATISTSQYNHAAADAALSGNVVTLTHKLDEHKSTVTTITVTEIGELFIQAVVQMTDYVDGEVAGTHPECNIQYKRVEKFFEKDILGTWEGKPSGKDTYGDGKQHRWEYRADGTYVYYVQNGNTWEPSANTLNEYFVDGNRLCTRWVDGGTEYCEWWVISTLEGVDMTWTAVRQGDSGAPFTSIYTMRRVN